MKYVQPYTMTSPERLWALMQATRYVVANDIKGHFVEIGVWRGGSLMTMASVLQEAQATDREIWGYDTFSGMTEPSAVDVEFGTGLSASKLLSEQSRSEARSVWCNASIDEVSRNIGSFDLASIEFRLIQGDIRDFARLQIPDSIALLRLDTDWYDSTLAALTCFFPHLASGGVCIIDDYGHWAGARRAVDSYLEMHSIRPYFHYVDYTGRAFLKP